VRLQLAARGLLAGAAIAAALLAAPLPARADGSLSMRFGYYKERSTRVEQPIIDAQFEVGERDTVDAHFLVDAITSASAASGALGEPFTEYRKEGGVGYLHAFDDARLGASLRYSNEPDYRSTFGSVRGEIDLQQKNTTLGVMLGGGYDDLDNSGSSEMTPRIEGTLTTGMISLSASQLLDRNVVASATYDLVYLSGDLENLYRYVAIGENSAPLEMVPDSRVRHAIAGSVRGFLPVTRTTLIAQCRFYADDWGLRAQTPELRIAQDVIRGMTVRLQLRYHAQSGADFYRDRYDLQPDYFTSDVKLSPFETTTAGIKIDAPGSFIGLGGWLGTLHGDLLVEYIHQGNRYGDAISAQAALTIPFEY
jgi:uncharacterized protein DUF3570